MLDHDDDENEDTITSGFPRECMDKLETITREFDARNLVPARFSFDNFDGTGAEANFIARELEVIREGLYKKRYPELKSKQLIPYDTNFNPGIEDYTAKMVDYAGKPTISRSEPDDVPTVKTSVGSTSMGFFSMVLGYAYSDQDARAAMMYGRSLSVELAEAVRDIMARTLDDIAFKGESNVGLLGLLTLTGTCTYAVPTTGKLNSALWSQKSPDAILDDLNGMGDQIINDTNEIEEPDTWLLPLTLHRLISNKRVGDGTSQVLLKYFTENRDTPVKVVRSKKCNTAGAGGTTRVVVYKNDPSKLKLAVPVEFEQKQPQVDGFKIKTNCRMRVGGLMPLIPKSICYADGQ